MNFPKILNFCPLFDQILGIFWSFLVNTPCRDCKLCCFVKKETFLMWNIAFLPIWFPSISPSNTSLRKTLPFCRSDLILVIKLEMRKPPFKRNPYFREKFGLTDFSLKSRFYCTSPGAALLAINYFMHNLFP